MEIKNKVKQSQTFLTKMEKYEINPFLEKAIFEIKSSIKRKNILATQTERKAVLAAVNTDTGEILGHTAFVRQIEYEDKKFVKLYLNEFKVFFDLSKSAMKVLEYILTQIQPNSDRLIFIMKNCEEYTSLTQPTISSALSNLCQNQVIARSETASMYFINPTILFNGNRVTFMRTYIRKTSPSGDKNQIQIPWGGHPTLEVE
jgi:hypothetical protein